MGAPAWPTTSTVGASASMPAWTACYTSNKASSSTTTKYTVTFDTNGGNIVSNQEVKKGGYVSKPSIPMKIGYNFLYWSFLNQNKLN